MKKHFLLAVQLFLLTWQGIQAQNDLTGKWQGAIEIPGTKLELSIDLMKEDGQWKGDLDIPIQKIKDMKLAELTISATEISFKLPEVGGNANYKGTIKGPDHIDGTFSQGGGNFPMNLIRQSAADKIASEKQLNDAIARIKILADSFLQKRFTPGMAVGIYKDGKVLLAEGYGYKDLEKKTRVTPNTQFAIGSSTKAFTTMLLGMLSDEGLLDWEKPVINYLPDFKMYDDFATKEMNSLDLTCHRSGLPRHDFMWYGCNFTRQEIYNRLRYLQPNKSFRTTWQYNNLMFMTAGYLVGKLTNSSWEEQIQKRIFAPLGMTNSNLSVQDMKLAPDAASAYMTDKEKSTKVDYRDINSMAPAGAINSSVNDMLKWVEFQLGDGTYKGKKLISETELNRMHSPQMLMNEDNPLNPELVDMSYGLGWMIYRYKSMKIVEHGGNIDGFTALVYLVPEKNLGIVVLTNQNGAGINSVLARYATDLILGLEPIDWYKRAYGDEQKKEDEDKDKDKKNTLPKRIEGTKPSHELKDYAGEYEHGGYGKMKIVLEKNQLVARFNNLDYPLQHWHYDVFRGVDSLYDINFLMHFTVDNAGNITGMTVPLEPSVDDIVFQKLPPSELTDPEMLKAFTGSYELEGTIIKVELRKNKLFAIVPGQPEYELEGISGTEFKLKSLNGYSLEFIRDKKGKVTDAQFNQPNGIFKAKRKDD